jgi:hypothetical protein
MSVTRVSSSRGPRNKQTGAAMPTSRVGCDVGQMPRPAEIFNGCTVKRIWCGRSPGRRSLVPLLRPRSRRSWQAFGFVLLLGPSPPNASQTHAAVPTQPSEQTHCFLEDAAHD